MEKQFDHQTSQDRLRAFWLAEKTYSVDNNPGPLYSIDTPPPTVSGALHIGHIFSYTQTDFIARYKRMCGLSVFYPFGFDDNGLPTERFVEKKREVKAHQLGRSKFIEVCLEETKIAEHVFTDLWQRMGLSADWDHTYSTISAQVRKLSQASFIDLYNKGFVYRTDEPALYCTLCRTSVAQAELDDKEVPSSFNDIVFKDAYGNDLLIGTTRPELLASCVALFFNPTDERYVHLNGGMAEVPLYKINVPILPNPDVDIQKGTGLVMCCTFGDQKDIQWYKTYKLDYKQSIGFDGKMTKLAGFLEGLSVADARKRIIEELIKYNLLIRQRPITHAVNVHERCKKEIEFVLLKQWFVHILKHKKALLAQADRINWYPAFMKARYKDWVEHLGWDWCISRQRFFGIPFPVWHCTDCNGVVLADTAQLPIDPQETPPSSPCTCGSTKLVADADVMDTWNTSSISPYLCAQLLLGTDITSFDAPQLDAFIPMSMRPQAHDIIRTWAFYTIAKVWMHQGSIAWRDIVISGHVLSDEKEKLSKSKENASLAPHNLLEKYPADVIRFWTASGSLGHDVAFSENQLKIGQKLVTKLWNAFWFVHTHITHIDTHTQPAQLGAINEWVLHTVTDCFTQYQKALEAHEFSAALSQVEHFFWNTFCDNYLELIKNQLFNPDQYDQNQVQATRWTLYHVGLRILQLYAPYLPYVTEAIYQELYKEHEKTTSLHQTKFATVQTKYQCADTAHIMEQIVTITANVRKLKSSKQLSLKTAIAHLTITVEDANLVTIIKQHDQLIRGITQAESTEYSHSPANSSNIEEKDGAWHAVTSNVAF
jgi:valyl-tRNA synthetase